MANLIKKILLRIYFLISEHIRVTRKVFDSIVPVSASYHSHQDLLDAQQAHQAYLQSSHKFFILPNILLNHWIWSSIWVLAVGHFDYRHNRFPNLPSHKVYHESFWAQSDVIVNTIVVICAIMYASLLANSWIDPKVCMYLFECKGDGDRKLLVNNQGKK